MGTRVINSNSTTTPLPYPLRGILAPGESMVFNVDKRTLVAAIGGLRAVSGMSLKFEECTDLDVAQEDYARSQFASAALLLGVDGRLLLPSIYLGGAPTTPLIGSWFRYNLTGGAGSLVLPNVVESAGLGYILSEVGGLTTALVLDGDGADIRLADGTTVATASLESANARGMVSSDGVEWELRGITPA